MICMSQRDSLGTRTATAADPPADAPPRGCTNLKLRQLTRRVSQHYDRSLGASGLKTTQYSLLSHVDQFGPIRPGDLAARMEMDASTLTRNLQPLLAQGWVEVGAGSDGRSRRVTITPAGHAKRQEAQADWKRAQLALNDKLGVANVARLHALIDDALAKINETGERDE
jgi:DNA-binding MarR family transcriptional regulator